MSQQQNIIKLAEAMGWKREKTKHGEWFWTDPQRHVIAIPYSKDGCPFRPNEHADDCEALMRWLRDKGWRIEIRISIAESVRINRIGAPSNSGRWHRYADWKKGVCELALKVIE